MQPPLCPKREELTGHSDLASPRSSHQPPLGFGLSGHSQRVQSNLPGCCGWGSDKVLPASAGPQGSGRRAGRGGVSSVTSVGSTNRNAPRRRPSRQPIKRRRRSTLLARLFRTRNVLLVRPTFLR